MPIYEFKCPKCDHITEVIQAHGDPPPKCEKCGAETVKKASAHADMGTNWGGWSR